MVSKATGSGHLLWPDGSTVETVPADFIVALDHAVRVISWMENLAKDEMPPKWKWHLDWEIESHFLKVEEDRGNKYSGETNDVDWEQNEFSSRFKK